MKKPILVGKGFFKKSIEEFAELPIGNEAVIVFDAMKDSYYFPSGLGFKNGKYKLKSNAAPEEVTLEVPISLENAIVTIENMTIDVSHLVEVVAVNSFNSQLILNNVIIKPNNDCNGLVLEGLRSGSIFQNVTITKANNNLFSAVIKNGASVNISDSLIENFAVIGGNAIVNNTLLVDTASVYEKGVLRSGNLFIENEIEDTYEIIAQDKSKVFLDQLTVIKGNGFVKLDDSTFELKAVDLEVEFENGRELIVHSDNTSQVQGSDFEVLNLDEQKQANVRQMDGETQESYYEDDEELERAFELDPEDEEYEEYEEVQSDSEETISALEELESLIGLENVKKTTEKFINVAKINKIKQEKNIATSMPSLHSIFIGNPGTGKTTVARLIARALYEEGVVLSENYVEVSKQDLVSEFVGKTTQQTLEVLESAENGVLFIDEAYTLSQNSGSNQVGQEAIDAILKYMEDHRDSIMIIFAGYTNEMNLFLKSNPGLESRIPNVFDFENYSLDALLDIGVLDLRNKSYEFNEEEYRRVLRNEYRRSFDDSNARWVRNFNEKLTTSQMHRLSIESNFDDDSLMTIESDDYKIFNQADDETKQNNLEKYLEELDNLVGLNAVKEKVKSIINDVKFDQLLEERGSKVEKSNNHMIFTGAPGTGKTTVARLIAQIFKELGLLSKGHLVETERSKLIGSYIGQTEEKTTQVVDSSMGGVLFIDEAYQLLPKEGSSNDFGVLAIETLITELENKRDKFLAIFAGYEGDMKRFLDANEGLKSRVPTKIHFEDYTGEEVAEIVYRRLSSEWKFNDQILSVQVEQKYNQLEQSQKSNGRWARNFVEKLLSVHKSDFLNDSDSHKDIHTIKDSTIIKTIDQF
ncbi:AAA family ATPase [Mammaliicoccus fleurettii]|uniref:AAA family ATPase n=1 Tax=Mammaliicoccus fleurettii TaxID=150056 RepID=UPI002DB9B524|nr:AAA family ATPase [Mammaliicoccus fleurettii]MEB7805887.1 AAA family ATPase [Mammaliicoccus fleurettii]